MSDKKNNRRFVTARDTTRNLSIKCYDEQLKENWATVVDNIHRFPDGMQVIAIKHDKDLNRDDIWEPSVEKPHYHIIYRAIDRDIVKHVSTILNMLGIEFVKGRDDNLWKQHGVETVKDFAAMTAYLTHETEQARLDCKYQYSREELVSNLSPETIDAVRDGYIRVVNRKVDGNDMAELDRQAFELGRELGDFDNWYNSLDFFERSHSKMGTVKESYYRGIGEYIKEEHSVLRLSIFIKGEPDIGKSYAAQKALEGKKILNVSGGGTGKFDTLTPSTDAIIMSDDYCDNLLNMADNYVCWAYRRNSNNQCWAGQYFIITSNNSFEDYMCLNEGRKWLQRNGAYSKEFEALKSRFYICEVKDGRLHCQSPSKRGAREEVQERYNLYKNFAERFNKAVAEYVPISEAEYDKIFADLE